MSRNTGVLVLVLALAVLRTATGSAQGTPNPHQRLGRYACTDCHTTSGWTEVRFDHARTRFPLTAQHAAVPCTSCHNLRDFAGAPAECRSCHQDPHRGDAGTDCSQCHNESGWHLVRPQEAHARTRLPDLGVHAAIACTDCHRQTGVQPFRGAVTPCVTCHRANYDNTTNPSHRVLAFPASCESCHQLSTWNRALFHQHDAIFGIYRGTHAGQWSSCASCHPTSGDYRVFTCTTCHADGPTTREHSGVPGYAWESTSCLGCHPGGGGGTDLAFHDAIFPVFSGTHAGQWTACGACHTSPADRRIVSCLTAGCHAQAPTDGFHQSIPGYTYATAECRTCHPDGRAGTFTGHDAIFPVFTGSHAGRWDACSACHTDPSSRQVFSCTSGGCHAAGETNNHHNRIPGYAYVSAQCLSCHPDGRTGTFAQHDVVFPVYTGPHAAQWSTCAQCHTVPGDRAVVSCVTTGCHAQGSTSNFHLGMIGFTYNTAQCRTCHPDGRSGTYTQHDVTFPIYSGTHTGQWTACASCHTDQTNRAVVSCMTGGCHTAAPTNAFHQGMTGYGYTTAQCRSCHPDGRSGTYTQHDARFAVFSGPHAGTWTACTTCHTDPANRQTITCMAGGCHAPAPTNTFHVNMAGYAYTSATCRSCHPDGRAGTFTQHDPVFPVYTGAHAGRWSTCTTCHTDATTRTVFTCTGAGCHTQGPSDAAHGGIPGYAYVSAQCYSCHPNGQTGTFAQHDGIFPVYSGPHASQWTACSQCHTTPGDRTVVSCMTAGCHVPPATDAFHQGMAGYGYTTAQCRTCHPDGRAGTFTAHDVTFPIYSGAHNGQWGGCTACHTDPASRAVVSCLTASCHTQTVTTAFHEGMAGYSWTTTACRTCHATGQRGTYTQHDAHFAVFNGPHAGTWAACTTCHIDPASRQNVTCVAAGCHAQAPTGTKHQGIPGYAWTSTQCRSCHPDGRAGTFPQHDVVFPIFTGTHAGRWADCTTCHTVPGDRSQFTCLGGGCHAQAETNGNHSGITGYTYTSTACRSCHPDGQSGGFAQHDAVFPVYSGPHLNQWTACAQCHTNPADRTVVSCMTSGCHAQPVTDAFHQAMTGYAYTTTQCRSCHPDGRRGTFTSHDVRFPIYSGGHAGKWGDCASCHAVSGNRSQFTCTGGGCHAQAPMATTHTRVPGYAYTSAQCLTCHPDGRGGSFPQHDVIFPVFAGPHAGEWTDCAQCHTTPGNRTIFSCTSGGCHAQAPTNTFHQRIPGYSYTSAQCLSCHPDGRAGSFPQHDVIFPIFSGNHAGRWTTCERCHNVPGSRTAFTCTGSGCHTQSSTNNDHQGVSGYQFVSTACLTCHPRGRSN